MHNQRYQSIRTFSVSLLVMSLFLLGANMVKPTPVAAQADLALTKTCESTGALGGSFHLEVRETGTGGGTFTDVVVKDKIPEFITLTSWKGDGSFNLETGVWDVGEVMTGTAKTIWIDFDASEQGQYTNEAEITAWTGTDTDMGNNSDSCNFVIVDRGVPDFVPEKARGGLPEGANRFTADLAVTKMVDVETAAVNGKVHYTVWVENLGPQSTAKVQATDHLPDCLTDVTSTPERGTYDGWFWDIGPLKKGEKVKLEVWATVGPDCSGTVTNRVWISRSNLPEPIVPNNLFDDPRPNLLNNHAEASFNVTAANGRVLDGTRFELGRNYPNPFNPTTMVPFSLAEASHVSIRVYDLLGREVSVLVDRELSAGTHEVIFEASALPTGVYLIRMEAAGMVQIQRMTLMK